MNKKGVTLVELIGAVVIFGLMISLVSIVITFILNANDRIVEQSKATKTGTLLIERLHQDFNNQNPTSYENCSVSTDDCVILYTAFEQVLNPETNQINLVTYSPPLRYEIKIENQMLLLNGINYDLGLFKLSPASQIIITTHINQMTLSIVIVLEGESGKTYQFNTQKTYLL